MDYMELRKELYECAVEGLVKAHNSKIVEQIEKVIRLDEAVKKCDSKWDARLEIEKTTQYGPHAVVILKPNEVVWKEVETEIERRKNSGPHLYFNDGDDWRRYILEKNELAPLKLSKEWGCYYGYVYNKRTKEVTIPMYECGVIK